MSKLTDKQRTLLAELGGYPDCVAECAADLEWRSARALEAKGLVTIIGGAPERPYAGEFFEAQITEAGLAALAQAEGREQ